MTQTPTTTAQTPAPTGLTLQAGAFYRTRDGRKVGPLLTGDNNYGSWYAFHAKGPFPDGGPVSPAWTATGQYFYDDNGHPHDLVAEWRDEPATPGPVATVTRTTTEIRPGVYGRLLVTETRNNGVYGDVCIQLVNRSGRIHGDKDPDPALMTAEELRAAAQTLNDLAAGLDRIEAERGAK